jgi:mannose-6-phosphate isomerase-like protein (cupin superfamily)
VERCIEHIRHRGIVVAVIIRAGYRKEGIEFFTPGSFSQQLAYMNRPVGYKISPHVHNEVRRDVFHTQEVLFVRTGKVKVDFYSVEQDYLESRVLEPGDVILLASGGHGFEMLENTELIEVKQGPYLGDQDKVRFGPRE